MNIYTPLPHSADIEIKRYEEIILDIKGFTSSNLFHYFKIFAAFALMMSSFFDAFVFKGFFGCYTFLFLF